VRAKLEHFLEIVRGVVTESSAAYELSNVVETALAKALLLAADAGAGTSSVRSPPNWRAGELDA
jgi:hypothetical protein